MKLPVLLLLTLFQINGLLIRSGPNRHKIIKSEREIGFKWKKCDEKFLPTYYQVSSYSPIFVEFLDEESNYNKTHNVSYRSVKDWYLNDSNYTYYLLLSHVNGSCYLYTYNPNSYNIIIETNFKTEFLPNILEMIMLLYFLYVFISLISHS